MPGTEEEVQKVQVAKIPRHEPTEETLFSLDVYEEYGDDQYQILKSKPKVKEEIHSITVIPQAKIKVYASKWYKPMHVIDFVDTGAASLLINPAVFPDEYWVPYFKNFSTISKGILTTIVITKHSIAIEFFPGLKYMTKLIGSDVPSKDLIIGFDIYRVFQDKLKIKANGIAFKKQFKPYFVVQRLFQLTEEDQVREIEAQITQHSYAESHTEFLTKCDNRL
ncbi:uncharacterized protein [Nicotiana tomentosiformis]|uniref:uncharacterized protein n=1 Tax=Nicotiana tomentosiformis TaxID=4098 RepID=UPI00051BF903|nr:uncharacterized protein LOC117281758 [Nicotiana tomentosiformis]